MRKWNIQRIATLSDEELVTTLDNIEANPYYKIQEIVYMGDNPQHIRIYQIIYTEEK